MTMNAREALDRAIEATTRAERTHLTSAEASAWAQTGLAWAAIANVIDTLECNETDRPPIHPPTPWAEDNPEDVSPGVPVASAPNTDLDTGIVSVLPENPNHVDPYPAEVDYEPLIGATGEPLEMPLNIAPDRPKMRIETVEGVTVDSAWVTKVDGYTPCAGSGHRPSHMLSSLNPDRTRFVEQVVCAECQRQLDINKSYKLLEVNGFLTPVHSAKEPS